MNILNRHMMKAGANVNFYVFFGGTNFGFTAGANDGKRGNKKSKLGDSIYIH